MARVLTSIETVLLFLMSYIAGFSASLGSVTWVILSEIFPNRIRGLALSVSTLLLWIADFAASFSFPVLNKIPSLYCCIILVLFYTHQIKEMKLSTAQKIAKSRMNRLRFISKYNCRSALILYCFS